MRWLAGLAVALLVVLGGCAQAPTADVSPTPIADQPTADDQPTGTATPAGTPGESNHPPDPDADVLGWENGYWHNETLPIDESDGLDQAELQMVVDRSMARVEHIRRVEFERSVPVEVVSRSTYREEYANTDDETETLRTFDNVKFELLFLVGETTDSLDTQSNNTGSNVLGFYSPKDDRIVVVSETDSPRVEETTLGHELVHALQFGQFNATEIPSTTRENHNARNGIVEGDARYVDSIYAEFCEAEWSCTTQAQTDGSSEDSSSSLHLGIYVMKYFPYSDGPGLVAHERSKGGWEAVNDIYDTPPESAEQVIDPEKYLTDSPTEVTLPDRSNGAWSRVTPADRAPYGSVGQASLTAMFAYPTYDRTRDASPVLSPAEFLNVDPDGSVNQSDPIDYDTRYANGWDGDKLWVYTDGEETAYTWRLVWDSDADAEEFAEGYRSLLAYWGGEPVDGNENVWRIPDGESDFADAFSIRVDGDTVTIVNAPSVDDLSDVHSSARTG